MSLGTTIALVFVIFVSVYKYLTWYFKYWKDLGVKGPKPTIFIGNFPRTHGGTLNFVEELNTIYLKYKSTNRFVGVFKARTPQLLILDPELALQLMTTHFSSFRDNDARNWTTPENDRLRYVSPTVATGNSWTEARSDIGAASRLTRLSYIYPVMQETAKKLSDFIKTRNYKVEMKETSRKFTVQFMADYIWGINADTFGENNGVDVATRCMIEQALKCATYYSKTAALPWLRKLLPVKFFPKSVDVFFTQLTKDASKLRLENPNNRLDLLNHLLQLQSKKNISETRMVAHTTTLLIGGVGTTALVIAHCILMIARCQKAQMKLRKEILENLNDSGTLSFDCLHDLPYLDQCVHEGIRMFPTVSNFAKTCTSSIELEDSDGSKVQLQPGDTIYISAYSFHHDEDYFEKAEEFIPERFDPDVGGTRKYSKKGVFYPFGDGPRKCIGMKLGLTLLKSAVAELVRRFEISVVPPTRDDNQVEASSFLLTLDGGIHLKFNPLS